MTIPVHTAAPFIELSVRRIGPITISSTRAVPPHMAASEIEFWLGRGSELFKIRLLVNKDLVNFSLRGSVAGRHPSAERSEV